MGFPAISLCSDGDFWALPIHLFLQMSLYLTFPVVMFWISNQAEWFEDYVVQRKVGIKKVLAG